MVAYLCLGSNLGDPGIQISKAVELLSIDPHIDVLRSSSLLWNKAYGKTDQPDFLNQIIEVDTEYPPLELLSRLMQIETALDRVRTEKWGPRTIDIDILLYADTVMNTIDLTLPHPDFHNRLFALQLLNELIPETIHPVLNRSISLLYKELVTMEETP